MEDPDFRERVLGEIEALRLEFAGLKYGARAKDLAWQAYQLTESIDERVPTWAMETVHARLIIEVSRHNFCKTGNPMYACEAFQFALSIGDPLPEWVLGYIEQSMSVFWRTFQAFNESMNRSRNNRPAEAFAEAFRMKAPKVGRTRGKTGRGTVWTTFGLRDWIEQAWAVQSVIEEWERAGRSIVKPAQEATVKEATDRYNKRTGRDVSCDTVRRAWLRYKREGYRII